MALTDIFYKKIYSIYKYVHYVVYKFIKDNCLESASALTYTTLISLVPLTTVTVYVLKTMPGFQDFWGEMQKYLFSHFVPATGRDVQAYLNQFVDHTMQLTIIGLVFIVISAMILIYTIENTFNRIWAIRAKRSLLHSILLYWSILTLTPLLMGSSFIVSSYLWTLPDVYDVYDVKSSFDKIVVYLPFVITWICFTTIYKVIPNCRVNTLHSLFGAFWAALFFECAKILFAQYVAGINLNVLIYGTFATIPLFLLWLYISWCLILLGAQMVNAIGYYHYAAPTGSQWRFVQAYKWLGLLWQAQQDNKALTAHQLFRLEGRLTAIEPYAQLEQLEKKFWIKKTERQEYILTKDLTKFSFYDLYKDMPWHLPDPELLSLTKHKDKFTKELINILIHYEGLVERSSLSSLHDNYNKLLL